MSHFIPQVKNITATTTLQADTINYVDTSGGAFDVTLPETPSNGTLIQVVDIKGSFGTENLTVNAGASDDIEGSASLVISLNYATVTFRYILAETKWVVLKEVEGGGAGSLTHFTEASSTSSPNDTVYANSLIATGSATDIDAVLSAKGQGATLSQIPDGTTAGGDKRGIGATDFQKYRGASDQVASGERSVIIGGQSNKALLSDCVVVGGFTNTVNGANGFIGAGTNNTVSGYAGIVVGGTYNNASDSCVIIGGNGNSATNGGIIIGGNNNTIISSGIIGGGWGHYVDIDHAGILCGNNNHIYNTATNAVIGGGNTNATSGTDSIIGGGTNNAIGVANYTVIGGGRYNQISSEYGTVLGGHGNIIDGSHAFIGSGSSNHASCSYTVIAGGYYNETFSDFTAIIGGSHAFARNFGGFYHASGQFANKGDAQSGLLVTRNRTIDATPTDLYLDGSATEIAIAINTTVYFDIKVVARRTDSGTESASYTLQGCIADYSSTTAIVGSVIKTIIAEDDATWDVDVTAATNILKITATGASAKTIQWVARVDLVETGV